MTRSLNVSEYRDVLQRNCLDCVNSVMMKDCLVCVCIAWNYDVYLLIWCGDTKYYLVLLKFLLLGNFLYSAHAPKLEATNINCLRNIMPRD